VHPQQLEEGLVGLQAPPLFRLVAGAEVLAERRQPFPNSRSGLPCDPSSRMRQASSSSADSRWNWAKPATPPLRPDVGPPAQMRGGSKVKAPRKPSM
jgi:hypothetical protein